MEAGLRHVVHFLHQEPTDTTINNLFLQGRWHFSPGDRLRIQTYAHLGLVDNAGDYRLSGNLYFDLAKAGNLTIRALHQSFAPNLIQHQHYISQQLVWQNDWQKTFGTDVSLTWALPRFQLELTGQYQLIDNYLYYDTLAQPRQHGAALGISQLTLRKNFAFWGFHFNNQLTWQTTTDDVLRLPELYSVHSLYFEGRLFKRVLRLQLGADLRINTPYFADSYQLATGQFYLQNREEIDWYPDIDIFINFKVSNFRFFLKQENFYGYFTSDFHFQVRNYPLSYPYLRFGVGWQFLD